MAATLPSMSSRMLRCVPSTEVQGTEIQGSIEVHSLDLPVDGLDPVGAFKLALSRCNIDQKAAALEMEMDESLLSRQLQGNGNMPMKQAGAKLPRRFWIEFIALLGQRCGVDVAHFTADQEAMLLCGDLAHAFSRVMARQMRRAG